VSASGSGFVRLLGISGSGNVQFSTPILCASNADGNPVISELNNHRIQVLMTGKL
jgi:hypothetical protein